jgi:hypothetical protein
VPAAWIIGALTRELRYAIHAYLGVHLWEREALVPAYRFSLELEDVE